MAASNTFISVLNFIAMLLSIPILASGFWLAAKHHTECVRFLQWPILILGLVMLLLSMAGFVGSCWSVRWLLWIYLFFMFLIVILLLAFTVLALVVTSNEARQNQNMGTASFNQYQLSAYSGWLTKRVQKSHNWRKIRSCLADAKVCESKTGKPDFWTTFYHDQLNPLQLGCCKPPSICGYSYDVNTTVWEDPEDPGADADCKEWSNDAGELCFECRTCKAGLLANVKRDWHKVAMGNMIVLAIVVTVYGIGCCAFQNAKKDSLRSSSGYPISKGYYL